MARDLYTVDVVRGRRHPPIDPVTVLRSQVTVQYGLFLYDAVGGACIQFSVEFDAEDGMDLRLQRDGEPGVFEQIGGKRRHEFERLSRRMQRVRAAAAPIDRHRAIPHDGRPARIPLRGEPIRRQVGAIELARESGPQDQLSVAHL